MRKVLEDALLDVSKSPIIDSGDLLEAAEEILAAVTESINVDRASIWLLNKDSSVITCKLLIDRQTAEHEAGLIISQKDFPNYFQALLKDRNIVAPDIESNPATQEFYEPYCKPLDIRAMLDTPLRHKGKMIGILCCEQRSETRLWQQDEITFVGAMADLFGRAMSASERAQYEEKLRQQNEQLEEIVAERTRSLEEALAKFEAAQSRLIETEKMAALGNLVAGVAHEVNTPLGISVTAITHSQHRLQKLKKGIDSGQLSRKAMAEFIDETQQAYDLLSSNLERASKLIQNFKRTAVDQSSFELVECDIGGYLDALMYSLRPLLKKSNASMHIDCPERVSLYTYQGALAQIITNLVSNSCHHAFNAEQPDNRIEISAQSTSAGVTLAFRDNGKGMPKDVRKQIFDPFYTTARHSGGSGLGLYIVYNLVTQKLKGEVNVDTAPNKGALFELHLPHLKRVS